MSKKAIVIKTIFFLFSAILLTIVFYFFVSDRSLKEALFIGVATSIFSTLIIPAKNGNKTKWIKYYITIIFLVIAFLFFFQFWQNDNINFQVLLLIGIIGILLLIPLIYFFYRKKRNEEQRHYSAKFFISIPCIICWDVFKTSYLEIEVRIEYLDTKTKK